MMTTPEKLKALLSKEGRTVGYGVYTDESADPYITVNLGESLASVTSLQDARGIQKPTVLISVYTADFLAGVKLIETLKNEIAAADRVTVPLTHLGDLACVYDAVKRRYVFTARYRQISF